MTTEELRTCRNCRKPFLGEGVGEGFCSALCEAEFEYQIKLLQRECMTIQVHRLDDGGHLVQIKLRAEEGGQELVNTYERFPDALRAIANLCTTVADKMETSQ